MSDLQTQFEKYEQLKDEVYFKRLGRIVNVVGLTIESAGPDARLGDLCRVYKQGRSGEHITAEVVGFKGGRTILMPYEVTDGIGGGCIVENEGYPLTVKVGPQLLGKTLDGLGRFSDDTLFDGAQEYPVEGKTRQKSTATR